MGATKDENLDKLKREFSVLDASFKSGNILRIPKES